ncbi:MAG: acyl-CoA dehydratase activase [Candidatus Woesearchaeota archaeon]
MGYLGICIGASSINLVLISENPIYITHYSALHEGNPKVELEKLLKKIDIKNVEYTLITGRKFKEFVKLESISEPEAIEYALEHLKFKDYDTIISAGGENFIVYSLDKNGKISKVNTGNKCASGTGEFFLQQISRIGLNANQAIELGLKGTPHKISGRCSVFCKSDCTHVLNRGEKKENVIAGLCQMMANKILELLSKINYNKVLLIGGTSQNQIMVRFLKEKIKYLDIIEESTYFEALGAAYAAMLKEPKLRMPDDVSKVNSIFIEEKSSFTFHEPLKTYLDMVEFKSIGRSEALDGDVCIIGLDVGSTTTKAVILRLKDDAILASVYLRTNGDPIGASINCYAGLKSQITRNINIIGIGTTGSGRQIAGLHALTKSVINEIIAHATAAAYFDKDVDTIFEIGGQDAKYTYLTNGVPSDYAMNEACSAGTGSFLEESAKESLGIDYTEIASIALQSENPPNFNDQCAAFIGSDIKNATHEGLNKQDIVAGLVYSICMNYLNRVKGNRQIGKKIFMQGGVCYNMAIPVAMAVLSGKKIIVPPEPGLMGAFGVALEVKKRIELGLLDKLDVSLQDLIERKVTYHKPFKCFGNNNDCDRGCQINLLEIKDKKYPFGGACNKYYNINANIIANVEENDYAVIRQKLVYEKYSINYATNAAYRPILVKDAKTIGITRSFLTNTYYPLYYNFFTKLGFRVILSDAVDKEGSEKIGAAFCYPVEIAHGLFFNLLKKSPDFIFLPHVKEIEIQNEEFYKRVCVFVQSENYYLNSTFKEEIKNSRTKILSPIISFHNGIEASEEYFLQMTKEIGCEKKDVIEAYRFAARAQREMFKEFKELGSKALAKICDENRFGIVLFGRPYNAFAKEANLEIPRKFASRNRVIIPFDFLPLEDEESIHRMYWGMGGMILKAARIVKKNPLLFGCFITNFSCGPDSFIIPYFREMMSIKPSLTLELDSHSVDVGINTRIEAALDIMESYTELMNKNQIVENRKDFYLNKILIKNKKIYVQMKDELVPLTDKRVKVLLPSMGDYATKCMAAVFRSEDIDCKALPIPNIDTLKFGKSHTTCKECLPLILTTGGMIEYLNDRDNGTQGKRDELSVFFMAGGSGPCRLGQYNIYQEQILTQLQVKNASVFTLNDERAYRGISIRLLLNSWIAIIISEYMEDIRSVLRVVSVNKEDAIRIIDSEFEKIIVVMEKGIIKNIMNQLEKTAEVLKNIELKYPLEDAKIISLIGETYVRREEFSRSELVRILEKDGFVVLPTPTSEFIYYSNYVTRKSLRGRDSRLSSYVVMPLVKFVSELFERRIKKTLSKSGLAHNEMVEVEKTIDYSNHLISEHLLGESLLTVGSALREVLDKSCGVISLGPFACMPSRIAESILNNEMNIRGKQLASKKDYDIDVDNLPFLAIEVDGNMFPQILQSRIEIFMLQANRLHEKLMQKRTRGNAFIS